MSATAISEARLDFRLPSDSKKMIEAAAALLGQTVADFAVASLVETAQHVIEQRKATDLSDRDRDIFLTMLNDVDAEPNAALKRAAERYQQG